MENTRYKIVLVDDNLAFLNQGKALLQSTYKVFTFQSACSLFESIESIMPDLILLDVEMPDMDGFETIKKLKSDDRYKDIPVIFLTVKNDDESEKKGFLLGAVDYVTKPFSEPRLQKRISNQILYKRVQRAVKDYSDNIELMTQEISKEMQKAQAAETANRAKTQFLATMSHEIRTPMNSIMGFAELALNSPDSAMAPYIKDYLRKIFDNSRWLMHIIHNVIDIAKIESGRMELENIPFSLDGIFSRCQSVILPDIKEKKLEFRFNPEPLADRMLIGDPHRLYQALINLLSNAVKFTSTGSVSLLSKAKNLDNGKISVYFEVKDTGIGMDAAQIEKVFEPFIQGDSGMTRNYGGAGLGLAIVKRIVEMMGGTLMAESRRGEGSTFSFEIEFNAINASDYKIENQFDAIEKPYFEGLVLVCDDNNMNQEVVLEHLSRVGLKAVVAENGKEAVDAVKIRIERNERPFDLILMDIFMPVMDGIEAANKINELSEKGNFRPENKKKTPIVAMTANVVASELEEYKRHGMDECLGKPFTSQELWRILLKYLKPVKEPAGAPVNIKTGGISGSRALPDDVQHDKALLNKMSLIFYKSNQNTFSDIMKAVEKGDIELAHRITHSLKSNAGQIGERKLQEAAAAAEKMFANKEKRLTDEQCNILEKELRIVLDKLSVSASKADKPINETSALDKESAQKLLSKLEKMLKNKNPQVLGLIGEVRQLQGTEELVRQIEEMEFKTALEALSKIKNNFL